MECPFLPRQARHWAPYTGPRLPLTSAHSSQMVTLLSRKYWTLVSPLMNQSSSWMMERRCAFLVVTSGKPALKS